MDVGRAIVQVLLERGYSACETSSIDVAAALVRSGCVDMVLVNLSEYPAAALSYLARIVEEKGTVSLVATVVISALRRRDGRRRRPTAGAGATEPLLLWRQRIACFTFAAAKLLEERLKGHPCN